MNVKDGIERLLSWRYRFGIHDWGISWRAEHALSAADEGLEIGDILCSFSLSILSALVARHTV
jgi:hypothetical protein